MNKYILIIIVLFVTYSCKEKIEEIGPQDALSADGIFTSEQGAEGALIGVYGEAQDLEVLGSMAHIIGDFQADNVTFIGSFPTLNQIKNYANLANNATIDQLWEDNYEVVLAANAVIANTPGIPGDNFTQAEKDNIVGEAKFIRALVYFNMVNLFGQPFQVNNGGELGVPLVLDPFDPANIAQPARSTVNEVHAQIEQDLTDAIAGLTGTDNSRANVNAARGLLARLHLYREEWTEAVTQAALITGVTTPAIDNSFWTSQSGSEYLFGLRNLADDNGETGSGGWNSYYEPAEQGGRGDCPFSTDLIDAFDATDARFTFSEIGNNSQRYTMKFDDAVTSTSFVPVVRVSEVFLTHAEALARQAGTVTTEMVDLLNAARAKSGLTAFVVGDFATINDFIDAVLLERRLELAFEGHRRMDLLRNSQNLRPAGTTHFAASALGQPQTVQPIPQREIDLNPNLVQNPGY